MGDFDVAEEDVLIVLATHSPRKLTVEDMEGILQEKNSSFSVAFAGLDYSDDASGITAFFGKTLGLRASMRPGFVNEVKENEARARPASTRFSALLKLKNLLKAAKAATSNFIPRKRQRSDYGDR